MNIDQIVELVKQVPAEHRHDEEALKKVMQEAADQPGRSYSEEELDQFVQQFKQIFQEGSFEAMFPLLLKKGIKPEDLDEIKNKLSLHRRCNPVFFIFVIKETKTFTPL
ncbi:MAG: hypothetical protein H0Z33_00945 [Bacillaceae bacterium]|nr:hypothetical protein [Bacillaceae bacterium]